MTRILEWARLNNAQLAALDRATTIVLFPVGHTQQHGPHLPHGTLNIAAWELAHQVADLLTLTDRQRQALILPLLPYGTAPIDPRPGSLPLPGGSLLLRPETLGAVVEEIAAGVAAQEFRFLFVLGYPASPAHGRAIRAALTRVHQEHPALVADEIGSYLAIRPPVGPAPDMETLINRRISPQERAALETPEHGGTATTALMLALDANLVSTDYMAMESLPQEQAAGMGKTWPGYFGGAPALAEADLGRAYLSQQAYRAAGLIRKALTGDGLAELRRQIEL